MSMLVAAMRLQNRAGCRAAMLILAALAGPSARAQWTEQAKLVASDGMFQDTFGGAWGQSTESVAIEGDTVIVGAPYHDGVDAGSGAAYVYVRTGGGWTEQQKLVPSDAEFGANFGASVCLSGDTAIVGATQAGYGPGAAYVFVRNAGVWSELQKLGSSDSGVNMNLGQYFGYSSDLEGDTAIIGAFSNWSEPGPARYGAAFVFVRSGGVWVEQQKLTAVDKSADSDFGYSVSIAPGGDSVIVGAPQLTLFFASGAAYIFDRMAGVWTQRQKLTASDAEPRDGFGSAVGIGVDMAIVGQHGIDFMGVEHDDAYVFALAGGVWTEQQKLNANPPRQQDGFSLSIGIDGDTAIIGAPLDNGPGQTSAAHVFTRSGGTWTHLQRLESLDIGSSHEFGASVCISGDSILIGAGGADVADDREGAAYVFNLPAPINCVKDWLHYE